MTTKKKLAVMTALVIVGAAVAENVGTYFCSDCLLGSLAGPDEILFIQTVVNNDVDVAWVDSNGDPKTVTLCNASECVTYEYVKLTGAFKMIASWPQSTGGGGGDGGGGGGGGGGFIGGSGCYGNCDPGGIVIVGGIEPT